MNPSRAAVCLAVVIALAGCTGSGGKCAGAQGSMGQQGVCNEKDSFFYGVQGVKSGTERYTWENTGTVAGVGNAVQGAGSVTVTMKDAAGKQVFSKAFSGAGQSGGTEKSQSGQAGAWTIEVAFSQFSGQMALAVNRA